MSKERDTINQEKIVLNGVLARNSVTLREAGIAKRAYDRYPLPDNVYKYDPPLGADLLFSATRIIKSIQDCSGRKGAIVHYGIMYSIDDEERYFIPVGAVYLEDGRLCRVVEDGFTEDDLNLVQDMVDDLTGMKALGRLPNLDSLYLMDILDPPNP